MSVYASSAKCATLEATLLSLQLSALGQRPLLRTSSFVDVSGSVWFAAPPFSPGGALGLKDPAHGEGARSLPPGNVIMVSGGRSSQVFGVLGFSAFSGFQGF